MARYRRFNMEAYIQDISAFLPNDPVNNDTMEEILGMVGEVPSKTRRMILRSNGIKHRYYAIDPATGNFTHSNAQMTAEAVRLLRPYPGFSINHIECLCCGTSTPDQFMPGHGSMVHGLLGNPPCETVSTIGICLSGISAMKYALMNVASGMSQNAVATGSDLATSFLRAKFYNVAGKNSKDRNSREILPFEADFLRWMLSDGAGALFVAPSPRKKGRSLKLDWMDKKDF
jgi:3-oxoacyl-[acyl-carrier-protein] synthase-3